MSKIMRIAVLVVSLMSLFGIMSSAASAVTWTNSGQTHFTATGNAGTLTVTSIPLTCSSADATGDAEPSVLAPAPIATGTITFTGCTLTALRNAVHIECGFALTGTAFDGTGMVGSVVTGTADITCSVTQSGTKICHIGGQTAANYTNSATAGVLDVPASSTLRTSNGPTGTCPLGAGEASTLSALRFRVTSGTGPIITRD